MFLASNISTVAVLAGHIFLLASNSNERNIDFNILRQVLNPKNICDLAEKKINCAANHRAADVAGRQHIKLLGCS